MTLTGKLAACFVAGALFVPTVTASAVALDEGSVKAPVDEEITIQGKANVSKRLKAGFAAYKAGNFVEAEKKFSSALNQARNDELLDTQNLKIFGDDMLGANRPIFSYMTVIERKRLSAIYYMRGISQARQGKTDSAKVSIRKAIKFNAKNFDARVDYSLLELQSGNLHKAEKQMKRIKKLLKKCENEYAGDCDNLHTRFSQLQTVYAQTSVN